MKHRILGSLVTASSAEFPRDNDRQRWFMLAPYGEESAVMASGHKFTIPGPGLIELPALAAAAHINLEHDRTKPVGKFDTFKETAAGLYARITASATTGGNDALVEIDDDLRAGISVELDAPVIRAGKLLAGKLSAAGLTVMPSFGSARALAAAADVGDIDDAAAADILAAVATALAALDIPQDAQDAALAAVAEAMDLEDPQATPAAAPAEGEASPNKDEENTVSVTARAALANKAAATTPNPLQVLAAAQATLGGIGGPTVKAAALDQITQNDVFDVVNAPAYAGELWKGRRYTGRYLRLLLEAPMVAQSVQGWRWKKGKTPQVARWTPPSSGSPQTMNDIPTNEVAAEPVTHKGWRMAGGNAVDRIHSDMPSVEWWGSYNLESTDDYARKLDAEVIKHITDPKNNTQLVLERDMPAERRILEAIGEIIEFSDPNWILVGWDIFVAMVLEKKFDQSHAMSTSDTKVLLSGGVLSVTYLGLPVISAPRSDTAQNGRVLVGCTQANELQSLPGGPIRVEAQNIGKGLIEHGVFGYHILRDVDTRGVLDVVPEPLAAG